MPSNRMSAAFLAIYFLAILLSAPSVFSSSHDDRWGGSFGQGADESARRAGKRPAGEGSRGRQQNEPRIIYEPSAADVVHTDPANFRNVVQQLTGRHAAPLNQGHQTGAMYGQRPSRFFIGQQQLQPHQQQQMNAQFHSQYQQHYAQQQPPQDIESLNDSLQNINQRLDNLRRSSAWNRGNGVANQIAELEEEHRGIVNKIGELANQ